MRYRVFHKKYEIYGYIIRQRENLQQVETYFIKHNIKPKGSLA